MPWGTAPPVSAGKPLHPAAGSVAAEEADPASLLNWYRRLSALHQSNPTLGSAAMTVLNHDDQNVLAWVRKPAAASYKNPPVVVICPEEFA